MKRLFHKLVERWGRPTNVAAFNLASGNENPALSHIHIAIWEDYEGLATAFNTLGMSEKIMPHGDFFTELHFLVKGATTVDEQTKMAQFLANLAECPFRQNVKFDWWERLANPSGVPLFEKCHDVLFHPALLENDPDDIADEDGTVKILYVIPLTSYENYILAHHGQKAFTEYITANDVDPLTRR